MQRLLFTRIEGRTGKHHIAVTRLLPGKRTGPHTHDFAEIFFVESGTGIHHWNGRKLPLRRGSLVLVEPADAHWYEADAKSPLVFVNLAFAHSTWRAFLSLFSETRDWRRLVQGEPRGHVALDEAGARACLETLRALMHDGAVDRLRFPQTLSFLASHMLASTAAGGRAEGAPPEWLRAWRQAMSEPERLQEPIAAWQKRAGVSPAHLARTCRTHFGVPPTELLNRARIDYVKRRLRAGESKALAIAFDAGFQNLGFFYRCFRKFEGCTPRQWLHAVRATVPIAT